MIVLLSCVALVLWTVIFRYRRRQMYKLASKIDGCSKELPVIGVAHMLSGSTEDIMASLKYFCYTAIENGGMMRIWLYHILYIVLTDPVDMEMLLKTCLEKDDLHRFIRNVIGNGGIFAPVQIWKRRRKILIPTFSPKIVENFVEVFSEQSETLIDKLAITCDKEQFSVWPFISTFTLDSICQTAMGVKVNAQNNPNTPFLVSMTRMLNLVCERIFHLWLQPDWMYKFFPAKHKQHQKYLQLMHTFTDEVIRMKRDELMFEAKNKPEADADFDLNSCRQKSFLDYLITLSGGEKGYTNVELREEVLTLTVAGTDTSAVAICNTLKMFAKYPEVQDRVFKEVHEVFGVSNRPLVKEDLLQLKYLEGVVKETLRLFPPVPFIIRKILEDTTLPSGKVVPAGSGVVVGIWGVHRDPKYWGPDAEKFDPGRFLPERFNLKHACSYMPFSQGPRNCLGYQYALMSIKTCLTSIVRRFRVVAEPEISDIPSMRMKIDIMMKDVDGYKIALKRRDGQKLNSDNNIPA